MQTYTIYHIGKSIAKKIQQILFSLLIISIPYSINGQTISKPKLASATFGGGCFWCTEAVFQQIKGVQDVVSGYSGGTVENPTYKQVIEGKTGHTEVVRIYYDSTVIDYRDLVEIFIGTHDPTSLNRQGSDVGFQYRSVIFYHTNVQQEQAKKQLEKLARIYKPKPILTAIEPLKNFYIAEDEHQDFYRNNTMYPYCKIVIKPKLDKLLENFYPFIHWK